MNRVWYRVRGRTEVKTLVSTASVRNLFRPDTIAEPGVNLGCSRGALEFDCRDDQTSTAVQRVTILPKLRTGSFRWHTRQSQQGWRSTFRAGKGGWRSTRQMKP